MTCENEPRRALLRAHIGPDGQPDGIGLDYVEVAADGKTLLAYFIGALPAQLRVNRPELKNFLRVEGGRQVRDIHILDVDPYLESDQVRDDYLIIHLDKSGDFSTYTLRLVGLEGIDPRYDSAVFSFKIDCPADLDCAQDPACPPKVLDEPEINYLAKDYASFRQLLLDRMALIMPDWKERHVPDLGITLVELLAYTGDHLSYYQDAVATEAYLDTARQRISVRRHARLVDYYLHEGCNARAWLSIDLPTGQPPLELDLANTIFLSMTNPGTTDVRPQLSQNEFLDLPPESYEVFEALRPNDQFTLRSDRSEIHFYTWEQEECCLEKGSTKATLQDRYIVSIVQNPSAPGNAKVGEPTYTKQLDRALQLGPGDVLIFEEVIGPRTGNPADADPRKRTAVRLTKVTPLEDPLITTPVKVVEESIEMPTPLLEIEWGLEDALPFSLCLSATTAAPDCRPLENVSVARGNVILVDHGYSLPPEDLGIVPLDQTQAECECGRPGDVTYFSGAFRPRLANSGLTYHQPIPIDDPALQKWVSARALSSQDPRSALPALRLEEIPAASDGMGSLKPLFNQADLFDPSDLIKRMLDPNDNFAAILFYKLSLKTQRALSQLDEGQSPLPELLENVRTDMRALLRNWQPLFDLLGSGPDDLHFVVEIDNDGRAHLRFGDDELGQTPQAGSQFTGKYRLGNGTGGNLGAESISHIVTNLNGITLHVRNPLPASGGIDAEPIAEAKLYAPFAFRSRLERAILAEDYASITAREFQSGLQGASAHLDWNGSWYEVEVALDPLGAQTENPNMEQEVTACLERYRRMGHDLRVENATYVPLEIALDVCVRPGYLRGHVRAALLDVFSNGRMRNGQPGFFHPDNLKFGADIAMSRIIAAAQAVEGVSSVEVTTFKRLFAASNHEIENGLLPLGPFEIARIDNDPLFPENGQITFNMAGGR